MTRGGIYWEIYLEPKGFPEGSGYFKIYPESRFLINNAFTAAVAHGAVTAVAANIYAPVPLELIASLDEVIHEIMTH